MEHIQIFLYPRAPQFFAIDDLLFALNFIQLTINSLVHLIETAPKGCLDSQHQGNEDADHHLPMDLQFIISYLFAPSVPAKILFFPGFLTHFRENLLGRQFRQSWHGL